jgi:hypothetical protein
MCAELYGKMMSLEKISGVERFDDSFVRSQGGIVGFIQPIPRFSGA